MINPLTLTALKVAMLEDLVVQLYATAFMMRADPLAEATAFTENNRQLYEERKGTDPQTDLEIAEVWGELMDRILAEVVRRLETPAS